MTRIDKHILGRAGAIEAALTRLRILFASFQNKMKTKLECRYIVLSAPLSNYSDVCEWLLIPEENTIWADSGSANTLYSAAGFIFPAPIEPPIIDINSI